MYAYVEFSRSLPLEAMNVSGETTRSISLAEGAPATTTYGTRSPYRGSAHGSTAMRFIATIAAGGGGTRSE